MRGMVGAHASFTLGDDTLAGLAELAAESGAGVHIHVAEDRADEEDSLARCGERVGFRLARTGVLPHDSIAAHCVHVDAQESRLLNDTGVWIAHNCRSNMNNCVGRAPLALFGRRTMTGTDGIDGDMFAESRTAFFRAREDAVTASADTFVDMLARGAEFTSKQFGERIGSIERGAVADLLVLDYDPPTPLTTNNFAWHWMFAFTARSVRSVMVDGTWVVRDRQMVTVDEERVRAEARKAARRLWQRMETL